MIRGTPLGEDGARAFVAEAAERIRAATGMRLDLDQLDVEIVTGDEAVRLEREDARACGRRESWTAWLLSPLARKAEGVLGLEGGYFPSVRKLVVMKSVADGAPVLCKEVVLHELIHAAHHQTHPAIFDVAAARARAAQDAPAGDARAAAIDDLLAVMTAIEGLACFHGARLSDQLIGRRGPPNPRWKCLSGTLWAAAGTLKTWNPHEKGYALFQKLEASENSDLRERIFDHPEIYDVCGRPPRGTVCVPVAPGESAARGLGHVERLLALREDTGDAVVVVEPPWTDGVRRGVDGALRP